LTKFNLNKYKTFIFDCDGVILNSNKIKSETFKKVTRNFGEKISDHFLNFHIKNGGVSRNEKFKYFVNKILNKKNDKLIDKLILEYSKNIYDELLNCEVSDCLKFLKQKYMYIDWLVLTGGNEDEVKDIFRKKKIKYFKDCHIYGSPKSKYENFKFLTNNDLIKYPAIFFGDSEYDYKFSFDNKIDFIFVSGWTEFENWNSFCKKNNIKTIKDICELV
jgi:phosphoglycolate phosphatase-like HAD superfamily hydrolase